MNLVISGATRADGTSGDLFVTDGRFAPEAGPRATTIDAAGLTALPGLVDLHTHLREPGYEQSETVLTGSRAAAAGGFTAVHAMANTSPVADTAGVVEQVHSLGAQHGYVTVRPIGAVTIGLAGERLSEIGAMAGSRAKVTVFSDDGRCVSDALLMRRALEYVKTFGGVIAQHAQEPRLTENAQMNEGALSGELGLAGWPAVAEEAIIARDVLLAQHVGARLHICHVSTAGSVEVVRWAKARGIDVTAEATPHHLLLTEDLARSYDSRFKVNPPLRRDEDVQALRGALADGTIDIVATDHAPHPLESKECAWDEASFGMVGLESALSVVHRAMVDSGLLGWSDVARVLSQAPAAIGGLDGYDRPFAVGATANLTLYDAAASRVFGLGDLRGKSLNTPYVGRTLPGRVVATIHNGYPTVLDGSLVDAGTVATSASDFDQRTPVHSALLSAAPTVLASLNIDDNATRTRLLVYVLVGFAIIIVLAVLGWTARRRRQRSIPETVPLPADIGAVRAEFDGFYVSTTLDGEPLNRVAVRGLGFRARATVAVADAGVVLALPGNTIFIPRESLREVTRSNYTIDRVVEPGGLVLLAWTLGETKLDSYFRVEQTERLVAALESLLPAASETGKKA